MGFGDINPKSNIERVTTSVILLMGVAIFSYIMGMFTEILQTFISLNASLSEDEDLAKFFGLIKRFNKNKDLNIDIKSCIQEYFEYKWINDNNLAVSTEEDVSLLE